MATATAPERPPPHGDARGVSAALVQGDAYACAEGDTASLDDAHRMQQSPVKARCRSRACRTPQEQHLLAQGRRVLRGFASSTQRAMDGHAGNGKVMDRANGDAARDVKNGKRYADMNEGSNVTTTWLEETEWGRQSALLMARVETELQHLWKVLGLDPSRKPTISPLQAVFEPVEGPSRTGDVNAQQQCRQGSGQEKQVVQNGSKVDTADLQRELAAANETIARLKAQVAENEQQKSSIGMNGYGHHVMEPIDISGSAAVHDLEVIKEKDIHKLQISLQEKNELLLSLRNSLEIVVANQERQDVQLQQAQQTIERLQVENSQLEKAADDKRMLWKRAYLALAQQLDQLCESVELPPTWERATDEDGIIFFRQTDRACGPQLEDPRVKLVLQQTASHGIRLAPPSSPSEEVTIDHNRSSNVDHVEVVLDDVQPVHVEVSEPPVPVDAFALSPCEDIVVPPDDGQQHSVDDFESPLPEGWEMRVTTTGSVFFVNRQTHSTTWKDPRAVAAAMRNRSTSCDDAAPLGDRVHLRHTADQRAHSIDATSFTGRLVELGEDCERFDVTFEVRGALGIHFQANVPDSGATVRSLLPGMAAAESQTIAPFDRLVAVNKHSVAQAPFRHVMLLLQGGLRPLTLTFDRPLGRHTASHAAAHAAAHLRAGALDEEVLMDDERDGAEAMQAAQAAAARSIQELHPHLQTLPEDAESGDFTVADRIITGIFSLFWTPPDRMPSQVQTV